MARDVFVYWNKHQQPTRKVFEQVLNNYLGGIGEITLEGDRWTCTLPGTPTDPREGTPNERVSILDKSQPRWFEVYWHDDCIDVITHFQDCFTNAVADGFSNFCIHHWKAEIGSE